MDVKKIKNLIFLLIFASPVFAWNDQLCTNQLDYIVNAIASPREQWAVNCKLINSTC